MEIDIDVIIFSFLILLFVFKNSATRNVWVQLLGVVLLCHLVYSNMKNEQSGTPPEVRSLGTDDRPLETSEQWFAKTTDTATVETDKSHDNRSFWSSLAEGSLSNTRAPLCTRSFKFTP